MVNIVFNKEVGSSANEVFVDKNSYSEHEYINIDSVEQYFRYILKTSYFKNKNKSNNLFLANLFIKEYRYKLLPFLDIFKLNATIVFKKYADMLERDLPLFVEKQTEIVKYYEISKPKSTYLIKIEKDKEDALILFRDKFEDKTIMAARSLFGKQGMKYIFDPIFIESLFENISYLYDEHGYFDTKTQELNKDFKRSLPKELIEMIKVFINSIPENKTLIDKEKSFKRFINREIYKYDRSDFEIFSILKLIKEERLVGEILSSNTFIKLEIPSYGKLVETIQDINVLKNINKQILRMKSPKPHMLLVSKNISERLAIAKNVSESIEFTKSEDVQKTTFAIKIGTNEIIKSHHTFALESFIRYLNKEKELSLLGISKILVKKNINNLSFSIEYKQENIRELGDDYLENLLKEIINGEEWGKDGYFKTKKCVDRLKNFRLNYLLYIQNPLKENKGVMKKKL